MIGGMHDARALLSGAAPTLVLPARILRRVIRHHRRIRTGFVRVAHERCYAVPRSVFLACVEPDEAGVTAGDLPEGDLLLVAGDREDTRPAARRALWRARFHAAVHAALEARFRAGLSAADARRAIDRVGQVVFDEAREVMRHEQCLLPPGGDVAEWTEFAALYLEIARFEPESLPRWFPSGGEKAAIEAVLAGFVDADSLVATTRPPGGVEGPGPAQAPRAGESPVSARDLDPSRGLAERAVRASRRGNTVRAAVLEVRAGRTESARERLEELLPRLAAAYPGLDRPAWRKGLHELLARAGTGTRSAAGKALFDLQRGCVESERGVYAVDILGWLRSGFRRPVRRDLPRLREVLVWRRLARAVRRIEREGLATGEFGEALARTVALAEQRMRDGVRPLVSSALEESGLRGNTRLERLAIRRAAESLLDEVAARGRLRLGDLRDAISGNDCKLPAVRSPVQWLRRDALLRADRLLAARVEGVYRRGEFYLRWLQRLSALALGTWIGALLVRFVILPFGGSYVLLAGVNHFAGSLAGHGEAGEEVRSPGLAGVLPVTALGTVFFLLLHWPAFRHAMAEAGRRLRGGAWFVLTLPARFARLPWVAAFLESRAARLLFRFVIRPAALAGSVIAVGWAAGAGGLARPLPAAALFLGMNLLLYSPFFRRVEERTADFVATNWRTFRQRVLAGLFRAIMAGFRALLGFVDRVLYRVDEWLRFRAGDPRVSLAAKAVVKPLWGFVAYAVRLLVTLVAEPQLNPIKHFPVVTVSHKVMLAFGPAIVAALMPLGAVAANSVYGMLQLAIPGICGFLAWELRENWRLFETNRPKRLTAVMIGSHGENMARLLRPGFHSGTVPRAFRKLRRAAAGTVRERRAEERLAEIREHVARFVTRHFLWLVPGEPGQDAVEEVRAGVNALHVRLRAPPLSLSFAEQSGRLLAGVEGAGEVLADPTVRNALVGLLARAGVDMVRAQVEAALPAGVAWDVSERGLLVWPDEQFVREVVYPLRGDRVMRPSSGVDAAAVPLDARDVFFSARPVRWAEWLAADEAGRPLLPEVALTTAGRGSC